MYVHTYICTYTSTYSRAHVRTLHMHVHTYVHTYVLLYIHTYLYVHTYVLAYTHTYVCLLEDATTRLFRIPGKLYVERFSSIVALSDEFISYNHESEVRKINVARARARRSPELH